MDTYKLPSPSPPLFPIDGEFIDNLLAQNTSSYMLLMTYDPSFTLESVDYRNTMIPPGYQSVVSVPADSITHRTLPIESYETWARHLVHQLADRHTRIGMAMNAAKAAVIGKAATVSRTVNMVGPGPVDTPRGSPHTEAESVPMFYLTHRMAHIVAAMNEECRPRSPSPEDKGEDVVDLGSNPNLQSLLPICTVHLAWVLTVEWPAAYIRPKSWRSVDFIEKALATLGDTYKFLPHRAVPTRQPVPVSAHRYFSDLRKDSRGATLYAMAYSKTIHSRFNLWLSYSLTRASQLVQLAQDGLKAAVDWAVTTALQYSSVYRTNIVRSDDTILAHLDVVIHNLSDGVEIHSRINQSQSSFAAPTFLHVCEEVFNYNAVILRHIRHRLHNVISNQDAENMTTFFGPYLATRIDFVLIEQAKYLVSSVQNAALVPIEAREHLLRVTDPDAPAMRFEFYKRQWRQAYPPGIESSFAHCHCIVGAMQRGSTGVHTPVVLPVLA
ncbi:hypothetical protein OF83DRAFT_1177047 [Amylostereum chailletii]|nr:hypothetical protein OF83DRAFT_1177047 [Amylostereum chailletii]